MDRATCLYKGYVFGWTRRSKCVSELKDSFRGLFSAKKNNKKTPSRFKSAFLRRKRRSRATLRFGPIITLAMQMASVSASGKHAIGRVSPPTRSSRCLILARHRFTNFAGDAWNGSRFSMASRSSSRCSKVCQSIPRNRVARTCPPTPHPTPHPPPTIDRPFPRNSKSTADLEVSFVERDLIYFSSNALPLSVSEINWLIQKKAIRYCSMNRIL